MLNSYEINELPCEYDVYAFLRNNKNIIGYTITFGNLKGGFHFEDKTLLLSMWRLAINWSKWKANGDTALYYNGSLIRSMINGDRKILENHLTQYPYKVTKYKITNSI